MIKHTMFRRTVLILCFKGLTMGASSFCLSLLEKDAFWLRDMIKDGETEALLLNLSEFIGFNAITVEPAGMWGLDGNCIAVFLAYLSNSMSLFCEIKAAMSLATHASPSWLAKS
jgi:hypothetical protein